MENKIIKSKQLEDFYDGKQQPTVLWEGITRTECELIEPITNFNNIVIVGGITLADSHVSNHYYFVNQLLNQKPCYCGSFANSTNWIENYIQGYFETESKFVIVLLKYAYLAVRKIYGINRCKKIFNINAN